MDLSFLDETFKTESEEYWRKKFKTNLEPTVINFNKRGLVHTTKWLSELLVTLQDTPDDLDDPVNPRIRETPEEPLYYMCKCYFDLKEYDRCAYFAQNSKSPCVRYLYFYSKYLALEKRRVEEMTEPTCSLDSQQTSKMSELRCEMEEERLKTGLDSYCAYLYGVVCKKLDLRADAVDAFCESVRKEPLNWGSWQELGNIIDDVRQTKTLDIPHDHWMKLFFLGHLLLELQMNNPAIELYCKLKQRGLGDSRYVKAQIATGYHNNRTVDQSIEEFDALYETDPFRLEQLDIYSNLLYVKENKILLSHLAHRACGIDKYRFETCCIIGNMYSLRAEHQKAVIYFQRALKINPQYLSAWTLMGHEYMELKNSSAAIQCYRHAIESNKRDYRAWYGLGQTYEILRMPSYGLYYYQQAHMLRPNDSRMLTAIGDTFEKLNQHNNALRSYKLARNVGDVEGTALIKLAKLLVKMGQHNIAANLYKEFTDECEARETCDESELCKAYQYLGTHCFKNKQCAEAYAYAEKCLGYEETKEEAKALLKCIADAQKKKEKEGESPMEEEFEADADAEVEGEGEGEQKRPGMIVGRRLWSSPASSGGDSTNDNF